MPDRLLTPLEAAERLAVKRSTIYDWAAHRKIESVQVGRLLRFRESAIEKFVRDNVVPALGGTK